MGLSIPGALIHLDADPGSIDRFIPSISASAAMRVSVSRRCSPGSKREIKGVDPAFVEAPRKRGAVDADGEKRWAPTCGA